MVKEQKSLTWSFYFFLKGTQVGCSACPRESGSAEEGRCRAEGRSGVGRIAVAGVSTRRHSSDTDGCTDPKF